MDGIFVCQLIQTVCMVLLTVAILIDKFDAE